MFVDLGIELKYSFKLKFVYKIIFLIIVCVQKGGWKVYGVHLFQFVHDFSEFP